MNEIYYWSENEFVPLPEEDLRDDLPDRLFSLVIPVTDEDGKEDGDTTFVIHREMDDGPLCERQFVYLFDTRDLAEAMAGEAREALGRVSVRKVNVRSLDERFWVRLRLAFPDQPEAFLELWMSSETLRSHCIITNPLRDRDEDEDY